MSTHHLSHLFHDPFTPICLDHILIHLSLEDLLSFRMVSQRTFLLTTKYFELLECVNLTQVKRLRFNWNQFMLILKDNKSLRKLNLSNCKWIDEDGFNLFLQKQCHLVSVDVSSSYNVTNQTLSCLAFQCPRLERLILQNCSWLSVESIRLIAEHCHKLTTLDLTSCWNLDDECIIKFLQQRGSSIKRLVLARIYSITDLTMEAIQILATSLSYLDISYCWRITDNGIRNISQCTSLEQIVTTGCSSITCMGHRLLTDCGIDSAQLG